MDNGRTNAIFSNSEPNNPIQPEGLDEKDWQRSLEISAPADMPTPEALQEKANDFFTKENTVSNFSDSSEQTATENQNIPENQPSESQPLENLSQPNELGQITTIAAPSITPTSENKSFNTAKIKTTGDHLEKSTIPEIDRAINELNQTGNLNNFYDEIRGEGGMTDANLNNSFNRKLGDNQSTGGKA
ncbi:hypothetical protein IKG24_00935 [Candidatus Saccharibacteria bacterium]|nr:hypothetical protein [Candidatus Saccharibacteria bacterium]